MFFVRLVIFKVRFVEFYSFFFLSKFSIKGFCKKKLSGEGDIDLGVLFNDGFDDGFLVMDEISNDVFDFLERKCMEKEKCKKFFSLKFEKIFFKSLKLVRFIVFVIFS